MTAAVQRSGNGYQLRWKFVWRWRKNALACSFMMSVNFVSMKMARESLRLHQFLLSLWKHFQTSLVFRVFLWKQFPCLHGMECSVELMLVGSVNYHTDTVMCRNCFSDRLVNIIDSTGAASYHGFLPVLVRTCIQHMIGMWAHCFFSSFLDPLCFSIICYLCKFLLTCIGLLCVCWNVLFTVIAVFIFFCMWNYLCYLVVTH